MIKYNNFTNYKPRVFLFFKMVKISAKGIRHSLQIRNDC